MSSYDRQIRLLRRELEHAEKAVEIARARREEAEKAAKSNRVRREEAEKVAEQAEKAAESDRARREEAEKAAEQAEKAAESDRARREEAEKAAEIARARREQAEKVVEELRRNNPKYDLEELAKTQLANVNFPSHDRLGLTRFDLNNPGMPAAPMDIVSSPGDSNEPSILLSRLTSEKLVTPVELLVNEDLSFIEADESNVLDINSFWESEATQHVILIGASGVGKTRFLCELLAEGFGAYISVADDNSNMGGRDLALFLRAIERDERYDTSLNTNVEAATRFMVDFREMVLEKALETYGAANFTPLDWLCCQLYPKHYFGKDIFADAMDGIKFVFHTHQLLPIPENSIKDRKIKAIFLDEAQSINNVLPNSFQSNSRKIRCSVLLPIVRECKRYENCSLVVSGTGLSLRDVIEVMGTGEGVKSTVENNPMKIFGVVKCLSPEAAKVSLASWGIKEISDEEAKAFAGRGRFTARLAELRLKDPNAPSEPLRKGLRKAMCRTVGRWRERFLYGRDNTTVSGVFLMSCLQYMTGEEGIVPWSRETIGLLEMGVTVLKKTVNGIFCCLGEPLVVRSVRDYLEKLRGWRYAYMSSLQDAAVGKMVEMFIVVFQDLIVEWVLKQLGISTNFYNINDLYKGDAAGRLVRNSSTPADDVRFLEEIFAMIRAPVNNGTMMSNLTKRKFPRAFYPSEACGPDLVLVVEPTTTSSSSSSSSSARPSRPLVILCQFKTGKSARLRSAFRTLEFPYHVKRDGKGKPVLDEAHVTSATEFSRLLGTADVVHVVFGQDLGGSRSLSHDGITWNTNAEAANKPVRALVLKRFTGECAMLKGMLDDIESIKGSPNTLHGPPVPYQDVYREWQIARDMMEISFQHSTPTRQGSGDTTMECVGGAQTDVSTTSLSPETPRTPMTKRRRTT